MSQNPAIKQFQLAGVVYDLQVDSVNNCNPDAVDTNKYDWIGTQAEYVAQDVATNHPNWVCFITDDISDQTGTIDLTNYVKKTDNETISGTKTFTSAVRIERSSGQRLVIRQDSNNIDIGTLECVDDGNNNKTELFVFSEDGTQNAILGVNYGNGSPYAYAPTPASLMNNNTITTAAYITTVLSTLYPVGSLYLGTQSTCPLATLIPGSTWTQIQGRYLLASGTLPDTTETAAVGTYISAGLPNITGNTGGCVSNGTPRGCFAQSTEVSTAGGGAGRFYENTFDASRSSSIYGQSATVRPAAYAINVWQRTA